MIVPVVCVLIDLAVAVAILVAICHYRWDDWKHDTVCRLVRAERRRQHAAEIRVLMADLDLRDRAVEQAFLEQVKQLLAK